MRSPRFGELVRLPPGVCQALDHPTQMPVHDTAPDLRVVKFLGTSPHRGKSSPEDPEVLRRHPLDIRGRQLHPPSVTQPGDTAKLTTRALKMTSTPASATTGSVGSSRPRSQEPPHVPAYGRRCHPLRGPA